MEAESGSTAKDGLRRRELLIAGAAGGAALTLADPLNYAAMARSARRPLARGGKFSAGVMSGLPTDRGITLWTRLSGIERSSRVMVQVSTDRQFRRVVRQKPTVAHRRQGFAAKARVGGLRPHTEYYYRFYTKGSHSRVGKFRTLPPKGSSIPVRIGYYSCQAYEAGYFNAQRALAREDLDLVVCLGDYIYETSFFDGPADRADRTGRRKDGDAEYIDEYREKYALYQGDKDLQAMHAAHPFIAVWDDHEVEDNYAGDAPDPDNGPPDQTKSHGAKVERRIPLLQRRRNGYHAFFDSMPRIRVKRDLQRVYGSASIGSLVDMFFLDERQYRDVQACGDKLLTNCPEENDPSRTLLGAAQKRWLKNSLVRSSAKWKLLGNNDMLMSLDIAPGESVNPDQWDGYAAERSELGNHVISNGVKNVVAATGDIHTFFAGTVTTTGRQNGTPWASEFVGGSATSTGIPEALGVSPAALGALAASDPHISYYNFEKRGFGIMSVSPSAFECELKAVDALTKGAPAQSLAKFSVADGTVGPQQV